MKKRCLWAGLAVILAAAALLMLFLWKKPREYAVSEGSKAPFGALLTHLVQAYETPTEEDASTIAADLEAIRSVDRRDYAVARAVAEHWQRVYLDPDYRLLLYPEEPSAVLGESGIPNSRRHAIVVLGYELRDGEMQPELEGRCDAAAALARAFPETILVCSGGATGPNNPVRHTEAGLMKAYLVESGGLEPGRIYTDERAMTTAENAVNTLAILQENGVRSMTIVTSAYHQRWGQTLYNLLAELYRQQYNYRVEIVGNYCFDIEPSVPFFAMDDRIAVQQMAGILRLPPEALSDMPSMSRPSRPGEPEPEAA